MNPVLAGTIVQPGALVTCADGAAMEYILKFNEDSEGRAMVDGGALGPRHVFLRPEAVPACEERIRAAQMQGSGRNNASGTGF